MRRRNEPPRAPGAPRGSWKWTVSIQGGSSRQVSSRILPFAFKARRREGRATRWSGGGPRQRTALLPHEASVHLERDETPRVVPAAIDHAVDRSIYDGESARRFAWSELDAASLPRRIHDDERVHVVDVQNHEVAPRSQPPGPPRGAPDDGPIHPGSQPPHTSLVHPLREPWCIPGQTLAPGGHCVALARDDPRLLNGQTQTLMRSTCLPELRAGQEVVAYESVTVTQQSGVLNEGNMCDVPCQWNGPPSDFPTLGIQEPHTVLPNRDDPDRTRKEPLDIERSAVVEVTRPANNGRARDWRPD